MKKYLILLAHLLFSFSQIFSQVTCNVFELKYNLENNNLLISVDTDLPDNTVLMLTIYRSYWEKGNSEEYSINYFSEKATVRDWHIQNRILIDNAKWVEDLQKKQKQLASVGLGFDVENISDTIVVRGIIPVNQPNTLFGNKNSKLTGKKVNISLLRTVENEAKICNPLYEQLKKGSEFADPLSLKVGESCFVSKETPLMPEFSPSNPMSELGKVKYITIGSFIKILSIKEKDNSPWYEVEAFDCNCIYLGKGWINNQALMFQNLRYKK